MSDRSPIALTGAVTGILALAITVFAESWDVYTWRTERKTHVAVDFYGARITPNEGGLVVRARNLSDHPVTIDRVRLEYSNGRVLQEIGLAGAKLPRSAYVPIPGTVPAHAAGATYLTDEDEARETGGFRAEGPTQAVVTEASEQREFRSDVTDFVRRGSSLWLDAIGDVKGESTGVDIAKGSARQVGSSRIVVRITLHGRVADDVQYAALFFGSPNAILSATRTPDGTTRFDLRSYVGKRWTGRDRPVSGSFAKRVVTMSAPLSELPVGRNGLLQFAYEAQTLASIRKEPNAAEEDRTDYDRLPSPDHLLLLQTFKR